MALDSLIRLKQLNQSELSGWVAPIISGIFAQTGILNGVFYPRNSNPSGYEQSGAFISQQDLDSAITQLSALISQNFYSITNPSGYSSGIVNPGAYVTTGQTGLFYAASNPAGYIPSSQTGLFYPNSNPSGYITGGVGSSNLSGLSIISGSLLFSGYLINSNNAPANSNFVGTLAGSGASGANNSNFLGYQAGDNATNANNSNFLGNQAGINATNANNSNFFGNGNGASAINAFNSNFIGNFVGVNATNASNSTFIGTLAGGQAAGANNSIFIGYSAGAFDTVNNSGSHSSILIGDDTSTNGFSDSVSIGRGTANANSREMNFGNVVYVENIYSSISTTSNPVSSGRVGIGTNTPNYTLDVAGKIHGSGYYSATGASGINAVINYIRTGFTTGTITVSNGLITAFT